MMKMFYTLIWTMPTRRHIIVKTYQTIYTYDW